MKGKKSQIKYSRGTPTITHKRLLDAGEKISFHGVIQRLKVGRNLKTMQIAAEVEKEMAFEREILGNTITTINQLTSESENVK